MPNPDLDRINAFVSDFTRRQAARVVELPGGYAVFDDAFAQSHANNHLVIESPVDPEALPALAEEALGHLPFRMISVRDDQLGAAAVEPLTRAGYSHSVDLVMLHTGPVPDAGPAETVDLEALRVPVAKRWRNFLPDVTEDVITDLVERREARRRGADIVHFIGSRAETGEVAAWADLYLDPATGIAQVEDLVTAADHLKQGHGDAVLSTALRLAIEQGCGTRFLTADSEDWPRQWYERRGFSVIGQFHTFDRT